MRRNRDLPWCIGTLCTCLIAAAGAGLAQTTDLGIFTNEGGVGQTPPGGQAQYDSVKGEYRITGGGADLWSVADAFYFVWKQASGDMTFSADVQWVGTGHGHRMAVLMMRQDLDAGSAYADIDSRGDGLSLLQFRGAANAPTYQVITPVEGASRLRLVRRGGVYSMFVGKPNEEVKPVGNLERVSLKDPIYVGLGVCSHFANAVSTAIFSNVKLEITAAATPQKSVRQ
jgi:hypothetical protein